MHFSPNANSWILRPAGRPAGDGDSRATQRLATLGSQASLSGPVLIAEVGDEPWAAVETRSGRTVADPFRPRAGSTPMPLRAWDHQDWGQV